MSYWYVVRLVEVVNMYRPEGIRIQNRSDVKAPMMSRCPEGFPSKSWKYLLTMKCLIELVYTTNISEIMSLADAV